MRRILTLILGLCLLTCVPALGHGNESFELGVEEQGLERTVLDLTLFDYAETTIQAAGREYLRLDLDGEAWLHMEEPGNPHMPVICRSLMIPDTAHMAIQVLAAEYRDIPDVDLISTKGALPRTVDPATVPYTFGPVYREDAFFPGTPARLRDPYILRDVRGVTVELLPFQYNPVKRVLRVYDRLTVAIHADGQDPVNVLDRSLMPKRPDRSFWALKNSLFINGGGVRTDPPSEDGDMLVICHGAFMSAMQPFVTWKNSIGINTTMVDVATVGNNSTSIKNYIQGVYGQGNLAYVLLVGDSAEVASGSYGSGLSDAYYSTLTADWYPDIFVGRFSCQNTTHVTTQVDRTIAYEQAGHDLSMGGWNTWGMGIASDEGAGQGHYGESDQQHIGYIRNELLACGFAKVDAIYEPSGTKAQVTAGINEGRRVVNYCGHGSTTSWGSTGFSVSDVNNLTNTDAHPFIVAVACVNGNFGSGTCFAEAWLRATHNGQPSGAVGCYMSTVNQSWAPPMYGQGNHQKSGKYGAAERFWMEENWSLGGCLYGGSCCMMDLAGSSGRSEFMNWVIFGDPSLRLTALPALMMSFPDGLPSGYQPPGPATTLAAEIKAGKENLVPGSATLHYRYDPGAAFSTLPLTSQGGDRYEGVLPVTRPGDEPQFYFTAQGDGGTTITYPADAPATCYGFELAFLEVVFHDDFEQDLGWTVTNVNLTDGAWERGKPAGAGDRGDPTTDYDGSGKCYLTDNVAGNSDVDGGPTILTSPVFDLSGGDAEIGYGRWHYNDDNDDIFTVEVSNDNGQTWKRVEAVMHTDGWNHNTFMAANLVTPTDQMKVRFQAVDNPNDSVTEAGLDAFLVRRVITDPTLWADAYALSQPVGGQVTFTMDAGVANGGRAYLLLGSLTGTTPGFGLPGGRVVPINWDALTNVILASLGNPVFQGFMGNLDGTGGATAVFDTLGAVDPLLIGQTLNFAFLLSPPPGWDFASNAIPAVPSIRDFRRFPIANREYPE